MLSALAECVEEADTMIRCLAVCNLWIRSGARDVGVGVGVGMDTIQVRVWDRQPLLPNPS